MEQRNDRVRGLKSTGADGGDLLLSQAQLWIDLGGGLASMLRRMLGRSGYQSPAAEGTDAVADNPAGHRPPRDEEAA